jgi:hypothetical protein
MPKMKSMKQIKIEVAVNTVRDSSGAMMEGFAHFLSNPPKDYVKYCLEEGFEIPTIMCSRAGNGCATSIFDLQQHNNHAPTFLDEVDLVKYINRILGDANQAAKKVHMQIDTDVTGKKKEEVQKIVMTLNDALSGITLSSISEGDVNE